MKTVIFLDFDGVLHAESCEPTSYLCHVDLVQEVLREFLHAIEVVISSSWRDFYTLAQLRSMFAPDIGAVVVGVTPNMKNPSSEWLPGSARRHVRESEIETWLKANRPWGTPWLAIDDRPQWFREDSPNLLLTESHHGFAIAQQAVLRDMLRERVDLL